MQDNLVGILTELEAAIAQKDHALCHSLTAQFKTCFSALVAKPVTTSEQTQQLELALEQFGNLVQVLQDEKKEIASQLTQFKRNSAKLSKYTQHT